MSRPFIEENTETREKTPGSPSSPERSRLNRDLIFQIEAGATIFKLNRGAHRKDHLGQIESALSSAR